MLCFCPGMGCFWGAEKLFWQLSEVFSTQVGYAGGFTPNPNYEEVGTGIALHSSCVYLHIFTYAYLLHFDLGYLIALPPCDEVKGLGRTFLLEISRGSRDQKNAREKEKDTESERVF